MNIESYHRGRTVKTVLVGGVTDETDEQILAFAMKHAGEDKSSLFGTHVSHGDETTQVSLYTD